jgi:hypothetical protein
MLDSREAKVSARFRDYPWTGTKIKGITTDTSQLCAHYSRPGRIDSSAEGILAIG